MPTSETSQLFEAVKTHAFNRLPWPQRYTSNLYLDHRILSPGELLGQNIAVDRPTILVFADDEPLAGFGHPCRYLLYDQTGSLYRIIQAQFPPYAKPRDTLRAFHQRIPTSPHTNTFFVPPKLWSDSLPQGPPLRHPLRRHVLDGKPQQPRILLSHPHRSPRFRT